MPPNLEPTARFAEVAEDRPPDTFELSQTERQSHLWLKLRTEFTRRLQVAREGNDGHLDADETARIRGRIDTLKGIIALGDEPPTLDE